VEYQEELRRQEQMVVAPAYVTGHSRGAAQQRARQLRRFLDEGAPKAITEPGRANQVKALTDQLVADVIQPALLSRAQMRRNPAGAVGHHLRTEASKPFKQAALQWKRAMRALDPENADPDFTNYERFRAEGEGPNGAATFMVGAQIPGHLAMTPQAKANWPLGDPTVDTALKQAIRNFEKDLAKEAERLATQVSETETMAVRVLEAERRAAQERARATYIDPRGDRVPEPSGVLVTEPERQSKEQRRLKRLAGENGHTKKPRSAAQIAATARFVEAGKLAREKRARDALTITPANAGAGLQGNGLPGEEG
jgi:hypothetical protein